MENTENQTFDETPRSPETSGLWLTKRLMDQLTGLSRIATPLMVLCSILTISYALQFLVILWLQYDRTPEDGGKFYLFENGNFLKIIKTLASAAYIFLFSKALLEGTKAWRMLKNGRDEDDDLLEGTERLGKMFRWLTLWGGLFLCFMLFYLIA